MSGLPSPGENRAQAASESDFSNAMRRMRMLSTEPKGLFALADVVSAAEAESKVLHRRLLKLGDKPTSDAFADCLLGLAKGENCELRLSAIRLLAKAAKLLVDGNHFFPDGKLYVAPLEADTRRRVLDGLESFFTDSNHEICRAAIETITEFGGNTQAQVIRALAARLGEENTSNDNLLLILQKLRLAGQDLASIAAPQIRSLVTHKNENVAIAACELLGWIRENCLGTLAALIQAALGAKSSSHLRLKAMAAVVAIDAAPEDVAAEIIQLGKTDLALESFAELRESGRKYRRCLQGAVPAKPKAVSPRRLDGTYHRDLFWLGRKTGKDRLTPAKIRNEWNLMSDDARRAVSPTQYDKIDGGKNGISVVKTALKKAKAESA